MRRTAVAFLFPGQGSQHPGMLAPLRDSWPAFGAELRDLDARWPRVGGRSLLAHIDSSSERELADTAVAQPVLGGVSVSLVGALRKAGVEPRFAAGHSYGELVALWLAGAFDTETLGRLSVERGRLLGAAGATVAGAMLAVRSERERVTELIAGEPDCVIANDNAPRQVVVSGPSSAVARVAERARERGIAAVRLRTSCAFHSSLMEPVAEQWKRVLAETPITGPRSDFVLANSDASFYPGDAGEVRARLSEQVTAPVRWREQIEHLYDCGARVFVEVGPGAVLQGLVGEILGERDHVALAFEGKGADAATRLRRILDECAPRSGPVALPGSALTDFWEQNSRVVERYFAHQRELVERLLPDAAERREVALRLLETNCQVMADFLETQRAGGAGFPAPEALMPAPEPSSVPSEEQSAASELEQQLCTAIVELTGYPADMVRPESAIEDDLGLDSITLAELYLKLFERYPDVEQRAGELRGCRTIREVAALVASPPAEPAHARDASESDTASDLAAEIAEIVAEVSGGARPAADDDFDRALGLTAFDQEEIARRLVARHPELAVAGRALCHARDPGQLARLCERILGAESGAILRWERGVTTVEVGPAAVPRLVHVVGPRSGDRDRMVAELGERGAATLVYTTGRRVAFPSGKSFEATAAKEMAAELARAPRSGAAVLLVASGDADPLAALEGEGVGAFAFLKAFAAAGRPEALAVLGREGPAMAAIRGVARALSREWPDTRVRALSIGDSCEGALDVLLAPVTDLDMGLAGGAPFHRELVRAALPTEEPELARSAHVLLVGGGAGIAAEVAVMLAARRGCRISAVGRTAWQDTDPFADVADPTALRARVAERITTEHPEVSGPPLSAIIQDAFDQALRQKQLLSTAERVRAAGGTFAYARADAADAHALERATRELTAEHGPVDGVVHAAGLIDDAPIGQKTVASFRRVLRAKAVSAWNVYRQLAGAELAFAFLFSSLTGWTGNAGQTDYVAANEVVDAIAARWNAEADYPVRSLAWSVWTESGLAPGAVRAHLARKGIPGISDAAGCELFWNELVPSARADWALLAPPEMLAAFAREDSL